MNKFSKELIESLTEAREHAEGKPGAARLHVVEAPDVTVGADCENPALPPASAPTGRMG